MEAGNNPTGKKFDGGKDRWDLIPMEAVEQLVRVFTFGAEKYGPNNWQNLSDFRNRFFGAMMRHKMLADKGETFDPESGLMHSAQVAWNALVLLWKDMQDIPAEEIDRQYQEGLERMRAAKEPGLNEKFPFFPDRIPGFPEKLPEFPGRVVTMYGCNIAPEYTRSQDGVVTMTGSHDGVVTITSSFDTTLVNSNMRSYGSSEGGEQK